MLRTKLHEVGVDLAPLDVGRGAVHQRLIALRQTLRVLVRTAHAALFVAQQVDAQLDQSHITAKPRHNSVTPQSQLRRCTACYAAGGCPAGPITPSQATSQLSHTSGVYNMEGMETSQPARQTPRGGPERGSREGVQRGDLSYVRGTNVQNASYQRRGHPGFLGGVRRGSRGPKSPPHLRLLDRRGDHDGERGLRDELPGGKVLRVEGPHVGVIPVEVHAELRVLPPRLAHLGRQYGILSMVYTTIITGFYDTNGKTCPTRSKSNVPGLTYLTFVQRNRSTYESLIAIRNFR
eukprot:1185597-Prorocentrum_minimum.AAC.1